jgi:hypothetical protein
MKEIKPTDVSFVVPRYDWQINTVYDMYDDQYSTEVQGVDLISGGTGYGSSPYVYIGSAGSVSWTANTVVFEGAFLKTTDTNGTRYYIVSNAGSTGSAAPTHTDGEVANGTADLLHVVVSDGSGSGAAAFATVLDGKVIDVELTSRGIGYLSAPSVILAGGSGTGEVDIEQVDLDKTIVLINGSSTILCTVGSSKFSIPVMAIPYYYTPTKLYFRWGLNVVNPLITFLSSILILW